MRTHFGGCRHSFSVFRERDVAKTAATPVELSILLCIMTLEYFSTGVHVCIYRYTAFKAVCESVYV